MNSNKTNDESDLNGKTSFTFELVLDCENRKIQYFNEETNKRRKLNINLTNCPYPWRFFFYMRSVGDRVQLL